MKKLGKKINLSGETLEAYGICGCGCFCYCSCTSTSQNSALAYANYVNNDLKLDTVWALS